MIHEIEDSGLHGPAFFREDLRRFLLCNRIEDTPANRVVTIFALPGIQAVLCYRIRCWFAHHDFKIVEVILLRLEELLFGSSILRYYGVKIGPGLYMPHPFGIVIGGADIGRDFTIGQHCTIGGRRAVGAKGVEPVDWYEGEKVTIGDQVFMGAGSCVLGPVTVGDNVIIGANSVVTEDVPSNVMVSGVPARIVKNI
jgi:serine O-acetyltransferase